MFPISTILIKFLSEVLMPTSITALEINGNIPCKTVTTSIIININPKLFLYGKKYLRMLEKLFLFCSCSALLFLKSVVGSTASNTPWLSSLWYQPFRNSSCVYFMRPFAGSETHMYFLSEWYTTMKWLSFQNTIAGNGMLFTTSSMVHFMASVRSPILSAPVLRSSSDTPSLVMPQRSRMNCNE